MTSTLFEYMENVKAKMDAKCLFKAHLLKAVSFFEPFWEPLTTEVSKSGYKKIVILFLK
jgi:hypothetical protein